MWSPIDRLECNHTPRFWTGDCGAVTVCPTVMPVFASCWLVPIKRSSVLASFTSNLSWDMLQRFEAVCHSAIAKSNEFLQILNVLGASLAKDEQVFSLWVQIVASLMWIYLLKEESKEEREDHWIRPSSWWGNMIKERCLNGEKNFSNEQRKLYGTCRWTRIMHCTKA